MGSLERNFARQLVEGAFYKSPVIGIATAIIVYTGFYLAYFAYEGVKFGYRKTIGDTKLTDKIENGGNQ
jgi:hypothetical protein